MTNPPFGSKGKTNRKDILENFDLGYKWKKDKGSNRYIISKKTEKNLIGGKKKGDGQIPDVYSSKDAMNFLNLVDEWQLCYQMAISAMSHYLM